ncbi:anthranilate synthase component I family protein [Acetobacter oeni]|uniref:Para-aminobenzoate synthase n=1 Tax=Acetobacter oeni TaxID=304077 RepID=A0A511XMM8_9PROT|nr:anthranilate synthase component I family protein [Acetobacter oeni]MBB3884154.1 para-aminobenzoate synthetase component 1 [Acetobacter oeni]GBR04394.1 para-aminobenzoate synthase component I [Acetobacter oeni LMG 21952]GEN64199.1 para-aminobenzoate synthase [Acetobacter oeni]
MLPLMEAHPWAAYLDSGGEIVSTRSRWSFLCLSPAETLTLSGHTLLRNDHPVIGDPWQHLRQIAQTAVASDSEPDLPFSGGVIGLASYESGLKQNDLSSRHPSGTPSFLAASFTDVLAFDRREKRCRWISKAGNPPPDFTPRSGFPVNPPLCFIPDQDREDWMKSVRKIIEFIEAGDIFQANLTMRWFAKRPAGFNERAAYHALRATSPAPFGAWLKTPDVSLLSASVERFISLSAEGRIETRPIKGTAPAGKTEADKRRNTEILSVDEKELAENLMITDLMRHDIGRVSRLGSVAVPQLSKVEQFTHLLHLVSEVEGRLRPGLDAIDLLKATLPPGSVTGAPKKRAMEVIDQLETSARGAYCGSLFRISHDGAMDSSVIIRSLVRENQDRLSIGAGGGITWLSDPAREYDEMVLKATPLLKAFS